MKVITFKQLSCILYNQVYAEFRFAHFNSIESPHLTCTPFPVLSS
jgi:hypothetical protein